MLDALTIICIGLGIVMTGICFGNWKFGVYGLLVFLPFAGVPTIALYPAPPNTRLIKDLVFVIPAYLGFAAWKLRSRPNSKVPASLIWWSLALVALAVVHLAQTSLVVGLIGLKTWVLYLPLIALGYHLVDSIEDVDWLFGWLLIIAAIPIGIGVLQAVLYYGGSPDLAYGMYGAAASDVTQGFSRFEVGTGDLARMASTFTFVSQYYNFTLAALCLAYGHWRSKKRRSASRFWYGVLPVAAVATAALLTGARGAFVMVPLYFVVALVLNAEWVGALQVGVLLCAGLTAAQALLKTTSQDLFSAVRELTVDYLTVTQIGELSQALSTTIWGLGTGANTGPARFAVADPSGITLENYFAKAVMEFGVVGLVLISLLLGTAVWYAYKACRLTKHPRAKAYANALAAFMIISVINEWKGSYLDIDPLNVYFWFFLGVLLRIPALRPLAQQSHRTTNVRRITPRHAVARRSA
jgi:hypothetical protein